jgi:hypothetical protein
MSANILRSADSQKIILDELPKKHLNGVFPEVTLATSSTFFLVSVFVNFFLRRRYWGN